MAEEVDPKKLEIADELIAERRAERPATAPSDRSWESERCSWQAI